MPVRIAVERFQCFACGRAAYDRQLPTGWAQFLRKSTRQILTVCDKCDDPVRQPRT